MKCLLIDTGSVFYATKKKFDGRTPDYDAIYNHLCATHGPFETAIAYVSRNNEKADAFISMLRHLGLQVKTKEPSPYRVKGETYFQTIWDVEITLDALRNAREDGHIVICSSRSELVPLLAALQDRVQKVTVFSACPPKVMAEYARTEEIFSELLR